MSRTSVRKPASAIVTMREMNYDAIRETIKQRTIVDESDCWVWLGSKSGSGYGELARQPAHKASYRAFVGEYDAKLHLHHRCRNILCVNPQHLKLMTCARHHQLHRRHERMFGKPGYSRCGYCRDWIRPNRWNAELGLCKCCAQSTIVREALGLPPLDRPPARSHRPAFGLAVR